MYKIVKMKTFLFSQILFFAFLNSCKIQGVPEKNAFLTLEAYNSGLEKYEES